MRFPQSGGCQCGAIRYEITTGPALVYTCHCTECQSQSGAAFGMAAMMRREHFRITMGEPRSFSRITGSGRTMVCWYCADCGTRIFHTPGGALAETYRNLKPGTLDDTSWLRPAVHFWTCSAQPWVRLPEDAIRFETQPDREWMLARLRGETA